MGGTLRSGRRVAHPERAMYHAEMARQAHRSAFSDDEAARKSTTPCYLRCGRLRAVPAVTHALAERRPTDGTSRSRSRGDADD